MNVAAPTSVAPDAVSDRDVVLNFESIGDNCEFGLVQRLAGAEPLGLLRFSSAPIPMLLRALRTRFEGIADPAHVQVWPAKGEYLIRLAKYEFVYHTHVRVGEIEPAVLHQQQTRTLPFLADKLIDDLTNAEKIFVFRQNETLSANDLLDFRMALADYGPSTLLWVQQARPGHPAGSVDRIDDTLLVGYVQRLASRDNAPDLDLPSWLLMLRRALVVRSAVRKLWRDANVPDAVRPACIELTFGREGNARAYTRFGWSPAEDNHTFAIDERSLLTFPPPAEAPSYLLEMDIVPFVAPPALTSQRLDVTVNGETVRTFDPVEAGVAVCVVPGRIVNGHDRIDIMLTHPHARRPLDVGVADDQRGLAVMFRRLRFGGSTEPFAAATTFRPSRVVMSFGLDGPPRSDAEYGWALPEADFQWSLNNRSRLILDRPADASMYRLELDLVPFVCPPVLESQSLEVVVNGEWVHTFDPVGFGSSFCAVPRRLIVDHEIVELAFSHPRASRPCDVGAGEDTRRLAIMFRRVALTGLDDY